MGKGHRGQPPKNQDQNTQYEEDYGPVKNRSCTDVICLLLFVAFVGGWVVIGVWAISHGDPNKLLNPRDSNGLRCGIDPGVENLPNLFFFDLTKCLDITTLAMGCQTTQVCVETCPSTSYIYGSSQDDSVALPYCEYDHRLTTYNSSHCPRWFLPSTPLLNRCIYNVADRKRSRWKIASIEADEISVMKEYLKPAHLWISLTVHNALSVVTDDRDVHKMAQKAIQDIINSWWKILVGSVLALLISIIYILMLRWVAGIMVWISIAGVLAAFSAASYFSYREWQDWKSTYETIGDSASKTRRDLYLGIFIVVVIALAIILLMLIFLRKRIVLAIALIKEGSKAVGSVTSVLFFPIFPWILQIGVIAYTVCVGLYLATTGEPLYRYSNLSEACRSESGWTVETECNPNTINDSKKAYSNCADATCKFSKIANEAFYPYLQGWNVFGLFWLAFFVSALGQMVLAQVFAQWYWTRRKQNLPFFALTAAVYRTIRYHLGTLAFGSLIIAICRIIRVCLEYLDQKLKKYDNQFTKAVMCLLKCFFWCLEKFLKFINKNAYIMCAIHGKNFCTSAKDAFMLLMGNIIRVVVLDKITDFLFFLSKLVITAGVGAIAYVCFATDLVMDNSKLTYGLSPVIMLMIIAYLIATLFFSVYSMAVDTLFLCFLEDSEKNDGKSRPYYMSRNLMKIFGKKNVKYD